MYYFQTKKCPWPVLPKSINLFKMLNTLNHAPICTVHAASYDNIECVIKWYIKSKMTCRETRNMMEEINIHRRMDHPHIVDFYGVFEDTICVYIVIEKCKLDLFEHLIRTKLSEDQVCKDIVKPMLDVLTYLGEQRIVHRDIKPENIFLSKYDVWKLGDFGLAVDLETRIIVDIHGTKGYLPPEVLMEATVNGQEHKIDSWALGVLTSELITKYLPFDSSPLSDFQIPSFSPPKIDDSLSDQAKDFIQKAIDVNVFQRFSYNDLLHHPWIQTHTNSRRSILCPNIVNISKLSTQESHSMHNYNIKNLETYTYFSNDTKASPASGLVPVQSKKKTSFLSLLFKKK